MECTVQVRALYSISTISSMVSPLQPLMFLNIFFSLFINKVSTNMTHVIGTKKELVKHMLAFGLVDAYCITYFTRVLCAFYKMLNKKMNEK